MSFRVLLKIKTQKRFNRKLRHFVVGMLNEEHNDDLAVIDECDVCNK